MAVDSGQTVPGARSTGEIYSPPRRGSELTDARPLNTLLSSETGFDPRSLVGVAADLCSLPAVATQDWAERAADALTRIDPGCRVGIIITQLDDTGRLGNAHSAAAHQSDLEARRSQDPKKDSTAARMRLERLSDLGMAIPSDALTRGLAANAEDLGDWRSGPLARVWEAKGTETLLLGIAPIGSVTQDDGGSLHRCVVAVVSLAPTDARGTRPNARVLGALLPLLAERAALAMPAGHEIGWLTDREQDVLDRLTMGRSVREIAEDLGRSPHTVHDHVKSLHRKLSASSRGELVARALGHNPSPTPRIDPIVVERVRASTQIEPTPGLARRVPAV